MIKAAVTAFDSIIGALSAYILRASEIALQKALAKESKSYEGTSFQQKLIQIKVDRSFDNVLLVAPWLSLLPHEHMRLKEELAKNIQ